MNIKKKIKCIIPCGGFGTRIQPWSLYIPKELLPVNGQPVICKIVSEILEISAVDEIIFVTSPEKSILKNTLEKHFLKKRTCKFTFVVDKSHKGLDHSILLAKNHCKNAGATLLCWPDCFNKNNELKLLADNFKGSSLIGVTKVDDVRPYGNVIFDNLNKKIQRIIQKPKQNSKNKYVYWGKAILAPNFWLKFKGNLDEAFLDEKVFELKSKKFDTGNLKDYAITNYELTLN